MSNARILALTQRIIRQVLRDRRTLALVFVVPLFVMSLLYLVLSSASTIHTLAIVRPTGQGSASFNALLDRFLPASDRLKTLSISSTQVDTTLKNGTADAVLVFPADFADQLAQGQRPAVQIVLEGSDPNVASAMHDAASGLLAQLGVSLALAHSQQGSPPVLSSGAPFTVNASRYLYGGLEYTFNDSIAPVFIGVFSFFFVFLLTSVSFLRERSQGTFERIMASPMKRPELVIGYIYGFTLFALVQALVVLLFVVFVLRVHYSGNLALVFLVTALLTIGSVNLGIFLSTFAQNEFQVVQFIPLVLGVQVFLSGIFWPLAQLPTVLRPISYILPLTYANEALRDVMLKGSNFFQIGNQLGALLLFALLMVVLSSLTIRRQSV